MDSENQQVYLISGKALEDVIRGIIQNEFQLWEEKFKTEPRVLSREEAARIIGVSPNTISEYVKKGIIPNRGIGRRINILESDLVNIPKKRGLNFENMA